MSSKKIDLDDSNSIKCWCQGCGQEFRIHPLFPLVHSDLMDHKCPHTIPRPTFEYELIEVRPMEIPVTKILDPEWNRQQWQREKAALRSDMSDGMTDGYRMEREASDAEDREEKEQDKFDLQMKNLMRNRREDLLEYLAKRQEYFYMDDYQQKLYPQKKTELKQDLEGMRDALIINLRRLADRLEKKL